jgi:hypothetical protein
VDNGYVDICDAKRLKMSEVEQVEESIRQKFGFDDTLTAEEVDRLIEVQEERLKMAELRFMQSRLRKDGCGVQHEAQTASSVEDLVGAVPSSTQSCSVESLFSLCPSSVPSAMDHTVDQPASFDLDLQEFTSSVISIPEQDLNFGDVDWMGDMMMSCAPDVMSSAMCLSPIQYSFDFPDIPV